VILGGKSWDEQMPGLVDNRRMRKELDKLKKADFPKGLEWEG